MSTLNGPQKSTLQKIIQTLHPAIESESSADHAGLFRHAVDQELVADHIERRLATSTQQDQRRFAKALGLLESRWFCLTIAGLFIRFSDMDLDERVCVLQKLRDSRIPGFRRFFQSVKRLTLFIAYALPGEAGPNPSWSPIGYSGTNPHAKCCDDSMIRPEAADQLSRLDCEMLVIGSGAGGAVVAARAAAKGIDVAIVEKGNWVPASELGAGEIDGNKRSFEKHGALATRDLGIVVLAGSGVGGGTTVNWMTSLQPPESLIDEWARDHDLKGFHSREFHASVESVCRRLNVNTDESSHNPQNQKLFDGCQRLGFETQSIPRNAKRCGDCGFCNYGCRSGAKQDTRQTYLADAIQSGARLYAGTEVDRLLIKSGEVAGAYARIQQGTRKKEIEIRCKKIVVAAGSIHSPAILIRSGIDNKNLGEHLHLHPTTAIVGFHEDKIEAWRGAPQTVLCDQFANLDGHDHGVRFEVAPLHPGFAAMALAWRDPAHHKRLMQNMSYLSNVIVLCRDKQAGRVILNGNGSAEIQYQPAKHERIHLIEGAKQALRIQLAAGAWKMLGPHQTPVVFDKHAEHCPQSYRDFDRFIQRVETLGARPNSLSMFSAHQMSTCRMATRSARGVVDPAGQVFGVRNLFVADASVFPSASGVNPMITIMSIADYLSESISA